VFSPQQCNQKQLWAFHAFPMQFSRVWSKLNANASFLQTSH
jgi:hypothetical protein